MKYGQRFRFKQPGAKPYAKYKDVFRETSGAARRGESPAPLLAPPRRPSRPNAPRRIPNRRRRFLPAGAAEAAGVSRGLFGTGEGNRESRPNSTRPFCKPKQNAGEETSKLSKAGLQGIRAQEDQRSLQEKKKLPRASNTSWKCGRRGQAESPREVVVPRRQFRLVDNFSHRRYLSETPLLRVQLPVLCPENIVQEFRVFRG